jgi:hypothetical protein
MHPHDGIPICCALRPITHRTPIMNAKLSAHSVEKHQALLSPWFQVKATKDQKVESFEIRFYALVYVVYVV